jgi:DNA topoisomerase-1
VNFEFRGKSGKRHSIRISDRRLARIVKHCRDLPGQELFQYLDENGCRCTIGSGDVNAYLREISGDNFTAKDFRTWFGTVLACTALRELAGRATSARQAATHVVSAIDAVAGVLGNTRAVCRRSYIHPGVIDAYTDGTLARVTGRRMNRRGGLSADEMATLAILRAAAPARADRAA